MTPDSQKLRPAIKQMREGIKEFHARAQERIDDRGEWKPTHLHELTSLRQELLSLDLKLAQLENATE